MEHNRTLWQATILLLLFSERSSMKWLDASAGRNSTQMLSPLIGAESFKHDCPWVFPS